MSKIFKAILKFIKAVIKKIVKFIKKFWWVIVLVLLIWFAPVIAAWMLSSGAPAWLSASFGWVATTITPALTSAAAWVSSSVGGLFGAGSLWSSLSLGTKASLALGASALVMPKETGELIAGVTEGVVEVVTDAAGSIASGLLAGGGIYIAVGLGGFLLWKLLTREKKEDTQYVQVQPPQ